ncbi:TlpA family protein disulfide reductase [Nocardia sp. NBC_01388]|uniref:TlpA family protein disulfide reductase n=1 Tax=Nocardia sp. NBC_01388 TaxID=2903596 RepID=UPI003249416D
MHKSRYTVAIAAALTAVLGVSACGSGRDAVTQSGSFDFVSPGGKTELFYDPPDSRGTIGDLTGPALMTGDTIRISDYAGKVVLINVWGSWCAPCRMETPELEQVFAETQSLGVQFLGIDVRDSKQAAQDFVTARGVTYPSIFDPSMRSLLALGGHYPSSVVPTTMVLDRKHRVAAIYLKALLAEDIKPVIERIAAEE